MQNKWYTIFLMVMLLFVVIFLRQFGGWNGQETVIVQQDTSYATGDNAEGNEYTRSVLTGEEQIVVLSISWNIASEADSNTWAQETLREEGEGRAWFTEYHIGGKTYWISGSVRKHPYLPEGFPDIYYTNTCYSEGEENTVLLQDNEDVILSSCVAFAPNEGWLLEFRRTGKESEGNMKRRIYDIYLENKKVYSNYQLTRFAGWDDAVYVVRYYPSKQQIWFPDMRYDIPSQAILMEFTRKHFSNIQEKVEIVYTTVDNRYVSDVRYVYYTKDSDGSRAYQSDLYEERFSPLLDVGKDKTAWWWYRIEQGNGFPVIQWDMVTLKGVMYDITFDISDLSEILTRSKRVDAFPGCQEKWARFLNDNGYMDYQTIDKAAINQSFMIRWEGYYVADLQIFENGDLKGYTPQSRRAGSFEYNIREKYDNLEPGRNEYRVVGYNEEGEIVCDDALVIEEVIWWKEDVLTTGEQVIAYTSPYIWEEEERVASGRCYHRELYKEDNERSACLDRVKKLYTKSKQEACSLADGKYAYDLEVSRLGKYSVSKFFHKNGDMLTYPVYADTQEYISCDSGKDFEWSIFQYNCTTQQSIELINWNEEWKLGNCGIEFQAESERYLVYRRLPYEWHYCGISQNIYLLDKETGETSRLVFFDEKSDDGMDISFNRNMELEWFTHNKKLYKHLQELSSKESSTNNCFWFTTQVLTVDDAGTAMVRFEVWDDVNQVLVEDVEVDLMNRIFVF